MMLHILTSLNWTGEKIKKEERKKKKNIYPGNRVCYEHFLP
jgi:hypothetical protein